jgi:hypothetical protein
MNGARCVQLKGWAFVGTCRFRKHILAAQSTKHILNERAKHAGAQYDIGIKLVIAFRAKGVRL